eukprot:234983-Chlamydomonas_euryale.AAC.1
MSALPQLALCAVTSQSLQGCLAEKAWSVARGQGVWEARHGVLHVARVPSREGMECRAWPACLGGKAWSVARGQGAQQRRSLEGTPLITCGNRALACVRNLHYI